MLLDLFITHYKEPWSIGEKGFKMLSLQRCVDWDQVRITLVHDGTPVFPDSYFEGYPFKINQVTIPHGGIAAARNWCIDHAEADWIKWNDFDDMFAGVYSLKNILYVLNTKAFDFLWFPIYGELEREGRVWVKNDRDPVVLHGKMLRRQFLLDHKIRFNEELTWCEDSAFLAVVEMEIDHKRIGKITSDSLIYAWISRDGSLCNRPEIRFQNLQSFFKRHCYVADQFFKRGLMDQYATMCFRVMADSYYTLCRAPGIYDDKHEHLERVYEWYKKHKKAVNACTSINKEMVIKAVNRENYDGGVITLKQVIDWINNLERSMA